MSYEAFVLTEQSRNTLRDLFPPKYPEWVGHHVTHRFGVPRCEHPAAELIYGQLNFSIEVVGYVEEDGLEAFVCTVDGGSRRPDGGTYHLTWSLDREKGKKPVHSNDLIARKGCERVVTIPLITHFEYIA